MPRLIPVLATALLLACGSAQAQTKSPQPALDCGAGPLAKTYGGTQWLVYACSDNKSAVIVAAEGNPGMPFYFMSFPKNGQRQLTGEGTGKKSVTDAAFKDLSKLSDQDVVALIAAARVMPAQPASKR